MKESNEAAEFSVKAHGKGTQRSKKVIVNIAWSALNWPCLPRLLTCRCDFSF